MTCFARIFAVAALLCAAAPAWSATATTTMNVGATVAGACNITANAMSFGSGIPSVTPVIDAQADLITTCANGISYTVAASAGGGVGATLASRRMRLMGGSAVLNYTMYTNASRSIVWGDGTAGTGLLTGVANGAGQRISVYGRIFSGQTALSGAYTDAVTVTVTF